MADQKMASETEAAFWPRHTYMHTHIWIEYMYFSIRVLEHSWESYSQLSFMNLLLIQQVFAECVQVQG